MVKMFTYGKMKIIVMNIFQQLVQMVLKRGGLETQQMEIMEKMVQIDKLEGEVNGRSICWLWLWVKQRPELEHLIQEDLVLEVQQELKDGLELEVILVEKEVSE